ncbi:hypothetical protein AKJ66_02495 [candidate division MSBL1 archaeon SCGC-AAA259E22]|uniref:Transposase IS4-like domain-containing protein n=1 Tax=candidate division MSBL1 archaeon SCGC-AAA259E22 TaxID=1698265 RepID=A0A133UG78_9EURY|nr:hypothetical protein AKJ66_02495 [candidate division MSBL1 archaeon SCGC-AAA259E22]
MDAFRKAKKYIEKLGISIESVSLDKYYSSKKVLKLFGRETEVFVIPKENLKNIGYEWHDVLNRFLKDPVGFLKRYFRRNLSESGFSADKRRFGQLVRQKREDRRETALFSIAILHNVFATKVNPRKFWEMKN